MKQPTNGTEMFCPRCETLRYCKRDDDFHRKEEYPSDSNQHIDDLNWYQRGRTCLTCGHSFITVETDKRFLQELRELRSEIQKLEESNSLYRSRLKLFQKAGVIQSLEGAIEAVRYLEEGIQIK
jgi:hypothetical protein